VHTHSDLLNKLGLGLELGIGFAAGGSVVRQYIMEGLSVG